MVLEAQAAAVAAAHAAAAMHGQAAKAATSGGGTRWQAAGRSRNLESPMSFHGPGRSAQAAQSSADTIHGGSCMLSSNACWSRKLIQDFLGCLSLIQQVLLASPTRQYDVSIRTSCQSDAPHFQRGLQVQV